MSDYDKLKLAHELIEKIHLGKFDYSYSLHDGCEIYFSAPCEGGRGSYTDIDDLIAKLQELTQPEPALKDAWYLSNNEIACTQVLNADGYIACDKTVPNAIGRTMYASREKLIQAQIDYWTSLKDE